VPAQCSHWLNTAMANKNPPTTKASLRNRL